MAIEENIPFPSVSTPIEAEFASIAATTPFAAFVIFAQLLLLSACNIEPLAHPGSLRLSQALYCSPVSGFAYGVIAPRLSTGRLPSQFDILAFQLLRLF